MTQTDEVRRILEYLVSSDWDKAKEKNEIGLNKFDSEDGHNLVEQKEPWNLKQTQRALKICEKHRKQLPKELRGQLDKITVEEIEKETQQITDFRERTLGELKAREDQERIGEFYKATDGSKVLFRVTKNFNPSQHFDDKAYFLVKLPYLKPIFNKNNIKTGEAKVIGFYVITSDREYYRLDPFELMERDYVLEEPDDIPDGRWSIDSIKQFVTGKISIEPGSVFDSVRDVWNYHVDFDGNVNADVVHSLYTTLSYCYRMFNAIPYLLMQGEKGSAKSKVGAIHEQIDFNGFTTVAVTGPNLYRTIKDTQGTIIQDENEKQTLREKSENQMDIEAIINSGYQVNGKVSRIERIGTRNKRVWYPTYSPKILCGINSVTETIRDRSYLFIMLKTLNSEKANRSISPTNPKWQAIRDSLMILILNHWKEIKEIAEQGLPNKASVNGTEIELRGREWEKAFPLLVMARFFDKYKGNDEISRKVWEFLLDQQQKTIEISLDSFDQVIIESLDEVLKRKISSIEFNGEITLKEIAELVADREAVNEKKGFNLRSYSSKVKNKLIKLGIGKNFHSGQHNLTVFQSDIQLIGIARKRFNLNDTTNNNEDASSFNLISLINSISSFNSINTKIQDEGAEKVNQVNRRLIEIIRSRDTSSLRIEAEKSFKRLIELIELNGLDGEAKSNDFKKSADTPEGYPPNKDELSLELFGEAKNQFQFFKDPKDRIVMREVGNILRWLHFVKKFTEEEAQKIVNSWMVNKWVTEVNGQLVTDGGNR